MRLWIVREAPLLKFLRYFLPKEIRDVLALELLLAEIAEEAGWDPLTLFRDVLRGIGEAVGRTDQELDERGLPKLAPRDLVVNDFIIEFVFGEFPRAGEVARTQPDVTVTARPAAGRILERIADCYCPDTGC